MASKRLILMVCASALLIGGISYKIVRMGKQADGSFVVSSGQQIEGDGIPFSGRPIDIALHPSGKFIAVLSQRKDGGPKAKVFLVDRNGIISNSEAAFEGDPGFHGLQWTPDGKTLIASTSGLSYSF